MRYLRHGGVCLLVFILVAACSTPWGGRNGKNRHASKSPHPSLPEISRPAQTPKNLPRANPHVKLGKPYKVAGIWYTPKAEPGYVRTGIGSWYGPKFHGRLTSNGEIFDMNRVSAAHPTMPLPSIARVTNLQNGRQVVVRVNDRGPFARGRLIDLSRAAAEALGYRAQGLAKVKVEYLGQASLEGAVTRIGSPQSYANGSYAAVKQADISRIDTRFDTVRTRINYGPELKLKRASLASDKPLTAAAIEDAKRAVDEVESRIIVTPVNKARSSSVTSNAPPAGLPPTQPRDTAPAIIAAPPVAPLPSVTPTSPNRAKSPSPAQGGIPATGRAVSGSGWIVQAGAFGQYQNAQNARRALEKIADIKVHSLARPGGTYLYRVQLGPFSSEAAALNAAAAAAAAGYPDAQLIRPE